MRVSLTDKEYRYWRDDLKDLGGLLDVSLEVLDRQGYSPLFLNRRDIRDNTLFYADALLREEVEDFDYTDDILNAKNS